MFGFGKKETKVFKVDGMHCPRCSGAVKTALEKLKLAAEIDLETGMVTVCGKKIDEDVVKGVVEACGFDFKGEVK